MWRIMLVGGLGGILPSLLDKAEAWNSGEIHKWLESAPVLWIALLVACAPTVLYFVIGAVVAAVYEKQDLQKALLLGLGAPAFIAAAVGTADKEPQNPLVAQSALFGFVGAAHAQANVADTNVQLNVEGLVRNDVCVTCVVTFLGEDGRPISTSPLVSANPTSTIVVPGGTESLYFTGPSANPAELNLGQVKAEAPGDVVLDVGVNRSYWNDFARSLGAKNVEPFDFKVTVEGQ